MVTIDKSNICILLGKTFHNNVSAPALFKYCHTLVYIYYYGIFINIFFKGNESWLDFELVLTSL